MGWKKILIAASLIVVILFVAIYAFLSLYDFNKFKPILAQAVKEATGRELTLDGDITIELGLTPTILVEDVSFQNASWGSRPDLAKVKRMEIQVALLPLIRGDFKFVRLVMEEPVVIIETDSLGTSNFEFRTSDEQETTLPILIFQDVHIEKGLLTYKDGQSGDTYTVRLDHLKATIPGLDKSIKLDFEGAFDDIPVSLKGTIGPIVAWIESGHSWPTELTVGVGGASFNVKGEIRDPIHFKDLAFAVTGEGPSISYFVKLAGVSDMPELGAFRLEAKLADPEGKLALEVLDFNVGSEKLAEISLNGTIKDLLALQEISLNFAVQGKDSAKLTQFGLPLPPVRGAYSASGRIFDPEVSVYAASDLRVALGKNEIAGRVDLNLTAKPPYLTAKLTSKKFALGPFNLAVKLTGPTDKLALENMDLQIGTEDLAVMRLNGSIKDLLKLDGVNLSFRVHGKDLANLKKLSGRPLPVRGAFSASGQVIVRVRKDFKIPKLKITVGKNHIAGSLDLDLRSQRPRLSALLSSKKFDLANLLTPEISKLNWVRALVDLKKFRLAVKLAGFAKELTVEDVDFRAGTRKLAEVTLKGSIKDLSALRGINLNVAVQGENVANLEKSIGRPLPVEGAFALSGQIADPAAKVYKVSDLKLVLGENNLTGRLDLNLTGQQPQLAGELSTQKFNLQPLSISNVEILTKLKKLADLGPLKLNFSVVGPTDKLVVQQVEFHAGTEQLAEVRVKGAIKSLSDQRGLDLNFSVRGNEISKLAELTGQTLPIQGAYAVSGQITDPAVKNYKVSDLKLILGDNDIAGSLDVNLTDQRIGLATELSAQQFNLKPVTIPAIEWLTRMPDLGPLKLAVTLSSSGDKFAVENLDLNFGTEELIELMLKGTIKDLFDQQGVKLGFSIKGKNLAKLKKMGGPALPFQGPFNFSGQFVDPAPKTYKITSLKVVIGANDGSGSIELNLANQRPKVTVAMSSQKIDLRPLLVKTEKKDTTKGPPAKSDKKKDKVFSSKPWSLDGLKRIDADMKIQGKQVLVPHLALDDITADILLNNGNLTVEPIKFMIGGGSVNGRFNLHSQDKPSSLKMDLKIDQIDLGPMLDELGYQRTLGGTLNADIMLAGSGNSLADLMAGLNGRIYVGMKDGQVASEYLYVLQDILGTAVLQLINPFKKKETQTKVNCSINVINIKDGLAECNLLLDTDQTSIFCVGDVDLKTEKLDLKVKPVPKKGYGLDSAVKIGFSFKELSKPFRLGGTLAHPSLVLDTAGTVFTLGKLAGALLLGPIGITAFFADVSLGKKDPCLEALKAFEKEGKVKSGEKPEEKNKKDKEPDDNKTGAGKEEDKKSTGFFRKLFHKEK